MNPLLSLFVASLIIVGSLVATNDSPPAFFKQANFPCQEDEALMFIDTPSHDDTGCVNFSDQLTLAEMRGENSVYESLYRCMNNRAKAHDLNLCADFRQETAR